MDPDSQNIKNNIKQSLQAFVGETPLPQAARDFFDAIGYDSDRTLTLDGAPKTFFAKFPHPSGKSTQSEKDFIRKVDAVHLIFQLANDDLAEQDNLFNKGFDKGKHNSFMFVAADLAEQQYTRSDYATLTREISKRFAMPVFVLFRRTDFVSLAFAHRRPSRKPGHHREVLDKVSLLRDINCHQPHAGHLSILADLTFAKRCEWITQNHSTVNFDGLYKALLAELDTKELSKRFYRELLEWFNWAVAEAKFPPAQKAENHVIRLITRMLFVWFVKEKELIAEELFAAHQVKKLLKKFGDNHGDYYRAILQNLFFATLNTEIHKRGFSAAQPKTHRNFNLYRYADLMQDKDALLALLNKTPFINGGLFDCLDSEEGIKDGGYRIDCFTDRTQQGKDLHIPDKLFFDEQRGLLPLLGGYKFTVEESTPIEQEVALDPELLGNVFENLLANYNPETQETARRQTGSYYTPRAVVDYMVDVSLLAYLGDKVTPSDEGADIWQDRLRYLLDYASVSDDAAALFNPQEKKDIVGAIANIKVLDPAVGSGAFPMAVLHKLSLVLSRLDGQNEIWYDLQKKIAMQKTDAAYDNRDAAERNARVNEIEGTFNDYSKEFGRKLFLIQNSIFGVDIQPIACQIAKLRFFISLAIEQGAKPNEDNFGIKPLPNLETRFVAGNTLVGVAQSGVTRMLVSREVEKTQAELGEIRERHFNANTRQQKLNCVKQFKAKQRTLADELKRADFGDDEADKIAAWNPFDQNAVAGWFDPEWMFGEKDGFNLVIGNPPYIQLQKNDGKLGKLYKKCGFETFVKTGDVYQLFYEAGHKNLSDNGYLCFITSNSWLRAKYGEKSRQYFATKTQPLRLIDVGKDVFDAIVDANILLLCKNPTKQPCKAVDMDSLPSREFPPNDKLWLEVRFPNNAVWSILSSVGQSVMDKIKALGTPLKKWDLNINRGITTGYNQAFIIDSEKRGELIVADKKSAEIIKPVLRGRDIQQYRAKWAEKWLVYARKGIAIENYPAVYAHLSVHRSDLEKKTGGNQWYELQASPSDFLDSQFSKEKLIWLDLVDKGRFAYDNGEMFCSNTAYVMTGGNAKYLCAFLNSKIANWNLNSIAGSSGMGVPRWIKIYVGEISIPKISQKEQQPFIALVDKILAAKEKDSSADISQWQREIDNLVYELYGLTKEEIEMVEGIAG